MATAPNVLLVEDDEEVASLLATALRLTREPFEVTAVHTGAAALTHLVAHRVDCLLLDYRLPDTDGLDFLRSVRRRYADLPVIMLTGAGSEEVAVEAMKCGATDYLVKHGPYHRTVSKAIRAALRLNRAAQPTPSPASLTAPSGDGASALSQIIGESPALQQALALAARAAKSAAPVLLEGETGTGKELFTRAIHAQSARARGPLLALNCAALSETLLESELFGHTRGAFTGADRHRRGVFEEASGGTLFLDEVGEMSLHVQANLLRVVEDGQVRPIGTSVSRPVDVRVIAATNRDLDAAAREGRFRRDLYYRLRVFPIRLPPLRERREDIRLLALQFLAKHCAKERRHVPGFSPEALKMLEQHHWPGNVRELENEIHRLVLVATEGEPIRLDLLALCVPGQPPAPGSGVERQLRDIMRDVEVATVQERLQQYGYHRTATARSLGITREALWAKLRQLGVIPPKRGSAT